MSPVRYQINNTLPLSTILVANKEIPNIDVIHKLAAQSLSILFQKYCALVVLEQNIVVNLVSSGFHEVSSPTDCRHEVVGTHNF
jgi:hypothetical protein